MGCLVAALPTAYITPSALLICSGSGSIRLHCELCLFFKLFRQFSLFVFNYSQNHCFANSCSLRKSLKPLYFLAFRIVYKYIQFAIALQLATIRNCLLISHNSIEVMRQRLGLLSGFPVSLLAYSNDVPCLTSVISSLDYSVGLSSN